MMKRKIYILGLCETRMKGHGRKVIHEDHALMMIKTNGEQTWSSNHSLANNRTQDTRSNIHQLKDHRNLYETR